MGADDDAGRAVALVIHGPIARADLPGLSDRVCEVLCAPGPDIVPCDVTGVEPDAVTVDALARLELAAKRHGRGIVLVGASLPLLRLVKLMGLDDVLRARDA
ncbi:MAG: STAS domain-containing protein [Candidatus Dormibacteraeota bacterium]|nr:STAS domain-containing protein [Candidatus Dormibacteraeota bacterium]